MARLVGGLLVLHLAEAVVRAFFCALVGDLLDLASAMYFSFTRYTTVGYGDVVLPEPWRLLAPIEAGGGAHVSSWRRSGRCTGRFPIL